MTLEQQIDALAAEAERDIAEARSTNEYNWALAGVAYDKQRRCWGAERKLREYYEIQSYGAERRVDCELRDRLMAEAEAILRGEA